MATNFLRWLIFPPVSLLVGIVIAFIAGYIVKEHSGGILNGEDAITLFIQDAVALIACGISAAAAGYYILPKNNTYGYLAIAGWSIMYPLVFLGVSVISLEYFSFQNLILAGLTIASGVIVSFALKEA